LAAAAAADAAGSSGAGAATATGGREFGGHGEEAAGRPAGWLAGQVGLFDHSLAFLPSFLPSLRLM